MTSLNSVREIKSNSSKTNLFMQCLWISFLTVLISLFLYSNFTKFLPMYHTILELICIFIALSIFFILWHSEESDIVFNTLGYGFLIAAVFDIFHTVYFPPLNLYTLPRYDLSAQYWFWGRFFQALSLILGTTHWISGKYKKSSALTATLFLSLGLSYVIYAFPDTFPILLNVNGVTPVKILIEISTILLFSFALYNLKGKLNSTGIINYNYIFISIFLSIASEICFTLYDSFSAFSFTLGHAFKIASYALLFQAVFTHTFIYYNQRLKDTIDHYEIILDSLPVAIVTYNKNSIVDFANKYLTELLKCSREELIGLTFNQVKNKFSIDEKNTNTVSAVFEDAQFNSSMVETYKDSNGNPIKLAVKAQKIDNGVLVVFTDAKKDEELENLQLQTQTVLNSISSGILILDNKGKVLICNKALAKMAEMDAHDIIGSDISAFREKMQFTSPDNIHNASAFYYTEISFEANITNLKGDKKDLLVYRSPIKNVFGENIGLISIITDVTEYKKEREKLKHHEKLALVGQMAAGIVHEIKNPLATIKGFSQIIAARAGTDKIKQYSSMITDAVDSLSNVINDFLSFARPRISEYKIVSLKDILESMRIMIESRAYAKNIRVLFKYEENENLILADRDQIKQVILNMVENAIDAMDNTAQPELCLGTYLNSMENEMCLYIKDNGKGISQTDITRLGTPFFTTKEKGTGLGLSICYQIITDHKGRIDLTSKEGLGTVFTISIPCHK